MKTMRKVEGPSTGQVGGSIRAKGVKVLGGIVAEYRSVKRRLSDMLMRGDRDYAVLSALSQKMGRIRQQIRSELEHRRRAKNLEAAKKETAGRLLDIRGCKGEGHVN